MTDTTIVRSGHRVSRRPARSAGERAATPPRPRPSRQWCRLDSPWLPIAAMSGIFAILFLVAAGCGALS